MSIELLFFIGVIAGLIGPYILIKKQTLAVDAIAHGSFGGAALAYFLGFHPLIGALIFASLMSYFLTFYFKQKQEIVLGLTLVLGMSLGLVFFSLAGISHEEIVHYLFGNLDNVSIYRIALNIITGLFALFFLWRYSMHLFSVFFDPEGSQVRGINVVKLEGIFNLVLALSIVGMLSIVGALLVSGLMILPSLIAQALTPKFSKQPLISAFIGGLAMVLGYFISLKLSLPTTPIVIFLLALVYLVLKLR